MEADLQLVRTDEGRGASHARTGGGGIVAKSKPPERTESHVTERAAPETKPMLSVNSIEVIYDHVILVLKGVSLEVPEGGITAALLGANGAGKTTTLKAISNLLRAERGDVTKGSIEYRGERVDRLAPHELVRRGCVQVMEEIGTACSSHNRGKPPHRAFTRRDGRGAIGRDLDMVYSYFPRLKERRKTQAGYTSGGEQQMCAIGRALLSKPHMILLDEPSMGLAPPAGRGDLRDRLAAQRAGTGELPASRTEHQHRPADTRAMATSSRTAGWSWMATPNNFARTRMSRNSTLASVARTVGPFAL